MDELSDQYITIQGTASGKYEEKGSRFLAFGYPVHSSEEIKNLLAEFKETYNDARHICYAYTLGTDQPLEKTDDGGEPGHTAGAPILGQIHAFNLKNCIVIVVRYFGGTKLGAGNLRNAYKTAAKNCLDTATLNSRTITFPATIVFPYKQTNLVSTILYQTGTEVKNKHFDMHCTYELEIPRKQWKKVKEDLKAVSDLQFLEQT